MTEGVVYFFRKAGLHPAAFVAEEPLSFMCPAEFLLAAEPIAM
jgi:hypothetical protein